LKFDDLLRVGEPLVLSRIGDGGDSRLRALICIGGHHPMPRAIAGKHADEIAGAPIEFADAPYCELEWGRYFYFSVRDETFAAVRPDDRFVGSGVRLFTKSWLLGNVGSLSNGILKMQGGVTHFGLYCMNHTVDILAYSEPEIHDLGMRPMGARMHGPSQGATFASGPQPSAQEPHPR